MVVEGIVDFSDTQQNQLHDEHDNVVNDSNDDSATGNVIIAVAGALILIIGVFLLAVYIRVVRKRKGCPCFPTKEQRLARQLDTQSGNCLLYTSRCV